MLIVEEFDDYRRNKMIHRVSICPSTMFLNPTCPWREKLQFHKDVEGQTVSPEPDEQVIIGCTCVYIEHMTFYILMFFILVFYRGKNKIPTDDDGTVDSM